MMFSSKSVVLCPYTMKTIPVIKTDRPGKKDVDSLESAGTTDISLLHPGSCDRLVSN
jgi:hypothetical protein